MSWFGRTNNAPAPWDSEQFLLKWNNSVPWTIGDSFEGVHVFGDTGSGKTSGSAKALASAFLRADYGGLVLTVKNEDREMWKLLLEENGRSGDGVFFSLTGPECFNFLAYEVSSQVDQRIGKRNAVQILFEIAEMSQRSQGGANDFWLKATRRLLTHAVELLVDSEELLNVISIHRIVASAPRSLDEARDQQWQAESTCWKLLQKAKLRHPGSLDLEQSEAYWLRDFAGLPEKTRSSICETFAACVSDIFANEIMQVKFGGKSTVSPDDIFRGKIVIIDLPEKSFRQLGRYAAVLWKFCTQLAVERRTDKARPVFIFADECQYFLTEYDQLFQTTARSSRCATVYLTQNLSNYRVELPGDRGKSMVESLLGNLKTRITHQTSETATKLWCADSLGKHIVAKPGESNHWSGGKVSRSENKSYEHDYWLQPDYFKTLKTGGKKNNFIVTAIVQRVGQTVGNRRPHILARFYQKLLDSSWWCDFTTVAKRKMGT